MPRAYDRQQLVIDKNPLNVLEPSIPKLPEFSIDPGVIWQAFVTYVKDTTGIDLSGATAFIDWLGDQIGIVLSTFGAAWQALLDGVVRVWTGVTDAVGAVVEDVIEAIRGIFGTGQDAALSADNANIRVERLRAELAGGGFDEFDYSSAAILPSDKYALLSSGPGAGTYGPNGDGFVVWKPSGFAVREVIYRRLGVTLASNNGVVTVVWSTRPKDPLFADTYGYICGRMSNIANNTHIRASIDNNSARIQAVVAGTVTQIGPTKSLTIRNGDVFELWYGTIEDPDRIWLKQNGVTVIDVTDTVLWPIVEADPTDYRSVGFGCRVDTYVLTQNPAPALAGWTWAVQTEPGS
jgi:hypothetical protein